MKVLGVLQSPRRGGTSAALLEAFLEGAREAGAETELVDFPRLSVSGCRGCLACLEAGRCVLQDEMQPVYDKVAEAAVIAQAAPVYFDQVSAQAKKFLDRLHSFLGPELEKRMPPGKKAAFFLAYEHPKPDAYDAVMEWWAGRFRFYFGIEPAFRMTVHATGRMDEARRRELGERARQAGRRLAGG